VNITKKQENIITQVYDRISIIEALARNALMETSESKLRITALEGTVNAQKALIDELTGKLHQGDTTARARAKEAILAANAVEAHNRRWAVRILGLPAPTSPESTADAKTIATTFVNNKLKDAGFSIADIDCCHRVGKVSKEKQTMLVRLFERDLVDQLLNKKKMLKGSGLVLYEDATLLDRRLINALNAHPNVDSAWINHGTIWAKGVDGGQKLKVKLFDNIDEMFP
jgi:hypothetical protein